MSLVVVFLDRGAGPPSSSMVGVGLNQDEGASSFLAALLAAPSPLGRFILLPWTLSLHFILMKHSPPEVRASLLCSSEYPLLAIFSMRVLRMEAISSLGTWEEVLRIAEPPHHFLAEDNHLCPAGQGRPLHQHQAAGYWLLLV